MVLRRACIAKIDEIPIFNRIVRLTSGNEISNWDFQTDDKKIVAVSTARLE